jgi:hypothetical protein
VVHFAQQQFEQRVSRELEMLVGQFCPPAQEKEKMHYRNGREAKNGDAVIQLDGGRVAAVGVLHSAVPGNDYCNGQIAPTQCPQLTACLCDCLHADDLAAILAEKGLDKRPEGK